MIKFLLKKKVKKPLDISPEISDNITKEEVIDIAPSKELEEEIEEIEEIEEEIEEIEEEIEEIEEIEEELTPEEVEEVKKEIQREINTEAIRRDGWLDDVDNKK